MSVITCQRQGRENPIFEYVSAILTRGKKEWERHSMHIEGDVDEW